MKTYVLMLSKTFLKGHPREGEETDFHEKVKVGINCGVDAPILSKIHTIRANYELWEKRIDEVRSGKAVLSVRQWTGKPRRSKQEEIYRFDEHSSIGIEKLDSLSSYRLVETILPKYGIYNYTQMEEYSINDGKGWVIGPFLASNDGLSHDDWKAWFNNGRYDKDRPLAIIHFSGIRYSKKESE